MKYLSLLFILSACSGQQKIYLFDSTEELVNKNINLNTESFVKSLDAQKRPYTEGSFSIDHSTQSALNALYTPAAIKKICGSEQARFYNLTANNDFAVHNQDARDFTPQVEFLQMPRQMILLNAEGFKGTSKSSKEKPSKTFISTDFLWDRISAQYTSNDLVGLDHEGLLLRMWGQAASANDLKLNSKDLSHYPMAWTLETYAANSERILLRVRQRTLAYDDRDDFWILIKLK